MPVQEVRTRIKTNLPDPAGEALLAEIRSALGLKSVRMVRTARIFRFEGLTPAEADFLAKNLLWEETFQDYTVNRPLITDADRLVEVAYRPGVMNPEAASLEKAARDLGLPHLEAADSSQEYAFYGPVTPEEIELITKRLLVNATIQYVVAVKPESLRLSGVSRATEIIPLRQMNDNQLVELSRDKLFLSLEEMRLIQDYFRRAGRDPTDCEVEILAQTWSEHCVHKTFKARLVVDGREKKPLLKRLQEATTDINHPLVRSAYVDNSGVMAFYEGWAVCGKVETHNSPSAIEPYGGAATGSGGVFRDVMGTGQGARVIASTDMFCFAPPGTPWEEIPPGCLHPHYLLRRVVAGVRDYGNRMGIPTNNGSVHFHPDFRAKPTVIVGAYGLLPEDRCRKGAARTGDLVVVIGGRTGRDGIHGATFSSAAMTERTMDVNAQAVQIGHPIEEKRMSDAILEARDQNLIRAITDCGAGGFASAAGEMGADTGVLLALDAAPLKYSGLAPWEILLSESQERMVAAVAPENLELFMDVCRRLNVEATLIGEFTGDRRFRATFHGETVLDLEMSFLHDGLPQRVLEAAWQPPEHPEPVLEPPADWAGLYGRVMEHLNVCSKEPIIRMYDHGVQGTNALPPLGGADLDAPNDAVVLTPLLGRPYGLVIAHGLNPVLNLIDPYHGSIWAAAEAVSNAVAAGADPGEMTLIDNFIWPVPDKEMLGALDRAVDACADFSRAMGMPFISGKDSLSSTYTTGEGLTIRIPPVLCVSVMGRVPDVRRTVSADLKRPGSTLVLVGRRRPEQLGGSTYYDLHGFLGRSVPEIDLETLRSVFWAVHRAIRLGAVAACHDISEGGLAAAVAEMAFGGRCGVRLTLPSGVRPDYFLFNETAGCFVVELATGWEPGEVFTGVPYLEIGETTADGAIAARIDDEEELFAVPVAFLKRRWQKPMKEVFGA
ncbi:phosphoribosylformylglycinamidine synthase subunit PurL [Candidatus Desulforudis audaxviator]|uniref:phosphoribosylformylglycinamidine synthase subunit PurL n=1 Tax=Candidatus Desulforudis audaxviator TaxID=471827 RepID=UPI00107D7348|nr:phosphoribosylformylglycinamidine synthase subunit PurL [Candidatus Desulforudis audaxviator]AZK59674.1 Phosphoribosylformylglycinamidine synthase, PurS subunit [Candidatus Desulforudis audaxviator]